MKTRVERSVGCWLISINRLTLTLLWVSHTPPKTIGLMVGRMMPSGRNSVSMKTCDEERQKGEANMQQKCEKLQKKRKKGNLVELSCTPVATIDWFWQPPHLRNHY